MGGLWSSTSRVAAIIGSGLCAEREIQQLERDEMMLK